NGGFSMAVNTGGVTTFGGLVGNGTPLASLTCGQPGSTSIATTLIRTTGTQSYLDLLTLAANAALTTTNNGDITFGDSLDGDAAGGNRTLTLTAGRGNISVAGMVGHVVPLQSLTVASANNVTFSNTIATSGDINQATGAGTTTLNGGTTGNLTLTTNGIVLNSGAVSVTGRTTLHSSGGVTQNSGSLTTADLLLLGGGDVLLNQAGNDVTGQLAGNLAGTLTLCDSNTLTVGTVADVSGFTSNGSISLQAGGTLTVGTPNGDVVAGGSGTVLLIAGGASSDVQVHGHVGSTSGSISVTAGHNITFGGGSLSTSSNVSLSSGSGTVTQSR